MITRYMVHEQLILFYIYIPWHKRIDRIAPVVLEGVKICMAHSTIEHLKSDIIL